MSRCHLPRTMEINETTSWSFSDLQTTYNLYLDFVAALEKNYDIVTLSPKIVAPVGLLLNTVFLLAVFQVKSMHTVINVYLSNVAVADFFLLAIELSTSWLITGEVDYDREKTIMTIYEVTGIASFCFVTAIAVERFLAVRHPLEFRATVSKARAAKISAGLWALSLAVGAAEICSNLLGKGMVASYIAIMAMKGSIYVANVILTGSLYIYIVIKLRRQSTLTHQHPKRLGKVVFMLIINTVLFFILNAVEIILTIMAIIVEVKLPSLSGIALLKEYYPSIILNICQRLLRLINSSINPLVYNATNSQYRAAVIKTVSSTCRSLTRCCRSQPHSPQPVPLRGQQIQRAPTVMPPQAAPQAVSFGPNASQLPMQREMASAVTQPQGSPQKSSFRPGDSQSLQAEMALTLMEPEAAVQELSLKPSKPQAPVREEHIELTILSQQEGQGIEVSQISCLETSQE